MLWASNGTFKPHIELYYLSLHALANMANEADEDDTLFADLERESKEFDKVCIPRT